jgi:hypothetical protein
MDMCDGRSIFETFSMEAYARAWGRIADEALEAADPDLMIEGPVGSHDFRIFLASPQCPPTARRTVGRAPPVAVFLMPFGATHCTKALNLSTSF